MKRAAWAVLMAFVACAPAVRERPGVPAAGSASSASPTRAIAAASGDSSASATAATRASAQAPAPSVRIPGGVEDQAACATAVSEPLAQPARIAACKASCTADHLAACETLGDLADSLQIGDPPTAPPITALFGWSHACKGGTLPSACTKRDVQLAKLKGACAPKFPDACLLYAESLTYARWSAAMKKEQEELFESLCMNASAIATIACGSFASLAMEMDHDMRLRGEKALEKGCGLGDGAQCCGVAMAHDEPMPALGFDAKKAATFSARAKAKGYERCEDDRAERIRKMMPPRMDGSVR